MIIVIIMLMIESCMKSRKYENEFSRGVVNRNNGRVIKI